MGTKRNVVVLLLVALAAAAVWWFGRDVVTAAPEAGAANQPEVTAPEAAGEAASSGARADEATPAADRERIDAAAPEPQELAVLRGRCIDERGEPLAGCVVSLKAWASDTESMDLWRVEHGAPPDWNDPDDVTTAADGRFSFAFSPPPPMRFSLRVRADGRVAAMGSWGAISAGEEVDAGDIILLPGTHIEGRVVDLEGAPVAGMSLSWSPSAKPVRGAVVAPITNSGHRTGDDGRFRTGALPPGVYRVRVHREGVTLQSPDQVELHADRAVETVELVVSVPSETASIEGVVVDERGVGVDRVDITVRASTGWASASTRRDGTFRIARPARCDDTTATLALKREGYEVADAAKEPIAWGARGVELRVRRGAGLTVSVTDARGVPVPQYAVRLIALDPDTNQHVGVRAHGPHEGGVATIVGVLPGSWMLVVEFPRASGFARHFERFEHAGGDRRIGVRAAPPGALSVRVVTRAGAPVAGSQVQLCEPFGEPLGAERMVLPWSTWVRGGGGGMRAAAELADCATGGDGRALLHAALGQQVALRITGEAHMSKDVQPVVVGDAEELVVTVDVGARLTGKVLPACAAAKLRALAGESFASRPLRIGLRRDGQLYPEDGADNERFVVADDGSFSVGGLPPGAWAVELRGMLASGEHSATSHEFGRTPVVLQDGVEHMVDLDLSAELPGTVEAEVLLDGRPYANGVVSLDGEDSWANVTTDAEGRFRHTTVAGEYAVVLQHRITDEHRVMLLCEGRLVVEANATVRPTLVAHSGTLAVRLLDAADRPVEGVRLQFVAEAARASLSPRQLGPTDEQGCTSFLHSAGRGSMRVLPKALSTQEGRNAYFEAAKARGEEGSLDDQWIDLGQVVVLGGQAGEVTLRLPASAGY